MITFILLYSIKLFNIYTLPVGFVTFYGFYTLKFGVTMAGNVIAFIPILVFFIFFQRQLIEGIIFGGLKK
jgi:ABC-type glycerol-3-phosphate transport system permease component